MSTEEVLIELATVCAEAAADALRAFVPEADAVSVAPARVMDAGADPLANLFVPSLAAEVSYVDGVTGGNVFVLPVAGARALAHAMLGTTPEPEEGPSGDGSAPAAGEPLSELERSAVAEAMNQMMAAAAHATSGLLGSEVEISPPCLHDLAEHADAASLGEAAPHATVVPVTVHGVVCRLVQLVPYAFVVRMTRALDERGAELLGDDDAVERPDTGIATALGAAEVDLWVELGRAKLPAGRLAGVPEGEVLALDRLADDPVDVYVNGVRVGTGRLLVVDGSEWAVRIETMDGGGPPETASGAGGRWAAA